VDSEAVLGPAPDLALAAAPDRTATLPATAPPAEAWIPGFHGAIVDLAGMPSSTLRQVALAHRSSGLGRMDVLVTLTGSSTDRGVPRSAAGARPVSIDTHTVPSSGLAARPVKQVTEPEEPLAEYIDRRLAEAKFLLLPNRGRGYAVMKRLLDLVIASTLLIVFAPIMVILAIVIRLDSPGPAIFKQTRVTRGGRTFSFYKFRTMYRDARERFPELYDYSLNAGEFDERFYKLADDPRNTRVGRWLRRTTLDELPNLFNVITGDLSLVGPRPDLPDLVRHYRPEELACLFTKAGLTGVAQVAGRSLLTVGERLTLDMRYVAHQTLLLDIRILWRTVVVVLSGKGAF
jgi:lipopolysaccharide/colanic/teichoic acid biosynthesis glycosyltransferase